MFKGILFSLCVLAACATTDNLGSTRGNLIPQPDIPETTINLSPVGFSPATITWSPLCARPSSTSQEMWINLPVPTGAVLQSASVTWKGQASTNAFQFDIFRSSRISGDTVLYTTRGVFSQEFITYDMPDQSQHITEDGEAFSLRVYAPGYNICAGTVTVRYL